MTNRTKSTRAKVTEAVDDVIAEATQKARRARASASAGTERVAHDAADLARSLGNRDVVDDIRDITRRHPVATVAGAAIAGAVLSQILIRAARR